MNLTIITGYDCMWCDKVLQLMEDYDMTRVETSGPEGTNLRRFLKGMGITTTPAVFIDGNYIGGYEATKEWKENYES